MARTNRKASTRSNAFVALLLLVVVFFLAGVDIVELLVMAGAVALLVVFVRNHLRSMFRK